MTVIDTTTMPSTGQDGAPSRDALLDLSHPAHWAAKELLLTRAEFELAVLRGLIATVPGESGGQRRVTRRELDRLQAAEGFAEALRDRVRLAGTSEAADLLGITKDRFTRIARAGLLTPARFQLNRYRSVVWFYFADEVRELGAAHPELLAGRAPEAMRSRLRDGEDLRAPGWRDRMHQYLMGLATGPWERAAVTASFLDPVDVAEVVTDPHERALLNHHRLDLGSSGRPGAVPSPGDLLMERMMCARVPEEIHGYRVLLALSAAVAREEAPPRP
ncbi:DUF6397 family protein [Streptomyces indicus]|uniref:Uncharacterized protein n=1 Tax=Streptomyces indicus TaxID=417292 RepID=A0A1G8TJB3_9ACTN|nr:DUF6397 family protein [Streptomyces indicus]SDJ41553.1 hypothetical protein SAMN05421806_101300 [Streptomyces indicus]